METKIDNMPNTARFVAGLPVSQAFSSVFDESRYVPIPDGWLVAVTDVVKSREAIAEGRYKAVNMAGVAVISAVMNALGTRDIPYIFGGDGSALALSPEDREIVSDVLSRVATFVAEELDLELRAAIVPVDRLRGDGFDVRVEAVRLSDSLNNYAFVGGGVTQAETLMKSGQFRVPPAPPGSRPDLTGLSCRWTPISAGDGKIISLIVEPGGNSDNSAFTRTAGKLVEEFGFGANNGNPMPVEGPGVRWPASGMELEARASAAGGSIWLARLRLLAETLFAWVLFQTNLKVGGFEPGHYRRITSLNTDFRKIQDGLRMTLLLKPGEMEKLETYLEERRRAGEIRYGLCVQDTAVLTCYVPSVTEDSHMHFLDGAGGGYAGAASAMK